MKYLKYILKNLSMEPPDMKKAQSLDDDEKILEYLISIGIPKLRIIEQIEKYYGFSYLDLEKVKLDAHTLKSFALKPLRVQKILPFKFSSKQQLYSFVIADFATPQLKENIIYQCQQKGAKAEFFFAFPHEIEQKFNEAEELLREDEKKKEDERLRLAGESSVTEWVQKIIAQGISLGASDIHIEPQEFNLQVRFRIDGLLSVKEVFDFNAEYIKSIVIRIKVIAGMDITENRKPQDGSIYGFIYDNYRYDLRISSVATVFGEKIVLRVFDKADHIPTFPELGFSTTEATNIQNMLRSSCGIVYLAGATGSGKTTTLYTMIQAINSETINICTIEDPVEKNIKNVNQIQVSSHIPHMYPTTLKALLRQDPDVIVVGEVRDQETAEMCIKASLTGHLVLSTIHANSALDTISRLYNMNIEPYLLSAGALGFISQRLIRRLCPLCKREREPNSYEGAWLKHIAKNYKIEVDFNRKYSVPCGCSECNNIGYKGRTVLVETVTVDSDLKDMIANKENTNNILEKAKEKGFIPLDLNGYKKVLDGLTSIEEIMRIL